MWTIPDKGEGQDNRQSILFQEYLDVLVAGIAGSECVLAGGAVTAQGSPDMTCAVAKASILSGGVLHPVTAGNVTISTADSTHPRIDLVVADSTGAKQVRAGTAAAAPKPPARTAGDVVLAAVWVPAGDTTISSNQIVDMRMMRTHGPITIGKATAVSQIISSTTETSIYSLTLPSGLLLSGRQIRVTCGGTMRMNSGTPTVRLRIAYGGTTIFDDISGTFTADADLKPWDLRFLIAAQANNDQAMVGTSMMPLVGAITNPTTGRGDAWNAAQCANPIAGSAAVDSGAADRLVDILFTMSVNSIQNDVTLEYALVELI